MVLVGVGKAGCDLVDEFTKSHKKIHISIKDFPKKCSTAEEFEKFCPNLTKKLKFAEKECWVVLCGTDKVAGATLRMLESIKNKIINIIYVYPDPTLSTPMQMKRHNVVSGVLQQYTRSGLLNKMYLFSNKQILDIIGEQPITVMYSAINKHIAHALETIEWFKNQEPVLGTLHQPKDISRISTLSVGDFQKNEEKLLFSLDNTTEAGYIYSISKTELEKNKKLLKIIKDRIINDEKNEIVSSFIIYSSDHKQSFFYSLKHTHFIQEKK